MSEVHVAKRIYHRLYLCREAGCPEAIYSWCTSGGWNIVQHGENPEHRRDFWFTPNGFIKFKDNEGVTVEEWLDTIHGVKDD